jgi:hypothetical protein
MTEVAMWIFDPFEAETLPLNVSLSKVFDSTHFETWDTVKVRLTAKDDLGRDYWAENNAVVNNHALIADKCFAFANSYPIVFDMFSDFRDDDDLGKYLITEYTDGDFDIANMSLSIPNSNFIYVTSHGGDQLYETTQAGTGTWSGVHTPIFSSHRFEIGDGDVNHEDLVKAEMGEAPGWGDFPPYNNATVAPANFIFLDACITMQGGREEGNWGYALYPRQNKFTGTLLDFKNQFVGGWLILTNSYDSDDVAAKITEYLLDGYPGRFAILYAVDDLIDEGMRIYDENASRHSGRLITQDDWAFIGDIYAKVAGVYSGDPYASLQWYW